MRTIIVTNQVTAPNLQENNDFLNQYGNFVINFYNSENTILFNLM